MGVKDTSQNIAKNGVNHVDGTNDFTECETNVINSFEYGTDQKNFVYSLSARCGIRREETPEIF